jgi:hypothetical protein
MKRFPPALFLFLLAPICGELLSGSAPPVEYFSPVTFITLSLLYGGGAVLVRELAFRWHKGWLSILILGAAYGIIEEGLMVKSFFDPNWMDIGILGSYGRWIGVNWVWTVELIIFHATISIGIPILITNLAFPSRRNTPWIGNKLLVVIFIFLLLDVLLGFLAMTTYHPPLIPYLAAITLTVALILLAKRIHDPAPGPAGQKTAGRFWFGLSSFIAPILFFLNAWAVPTFGLPPIVPICLFIILVWLLGALVWRISAHGNWQPGHLAALASGALLFLALMDLTMEKDQTRLDDPNGMAIVGFMAMVLLVFFNCWIAKTKPPSPEMIEQH